MNEQHYLRNVIEAALLAAGRPVQPAELIQLFDENARPTMEQMRAAIDALTADYAERGIELKETASGVRVQVRRELAAEVSRLWPERPARYSRALLETLALIAYRQPITRGEIEAVRGVAVNPNIVKTLLERNWVRVVGTRDVPGRPEVLGTTKDFLDYFGLKSLDELPPLSELRAVGDINLQLDLQGAAGQPKADGQSAPDATLAAEAASEAAASETAASESVASETVAPEAAASTETAGDGEAVSADAIAASDASPSTDDEPSDEALLEGTAESAVDATESTADERLDDAVGDDEEGEEGDELSAEGGDSRELVAAPRDRGD